MRSVLSVDPDELEVTALGLRRVAAELEVTAGDIAGEVQVSWSGLAALEQAARRREVSGAVRALAPAVEAVAGGLAEVAVAAREQGETVRRHTRLRDEIALERGRMLAAGVPPEPLAAARWAERVTVLLEESGWHQRLVEDAEREFDLVQRRVGALLDEIRAHVPQIVWDLALAVATVDTVRDGWRQVAAAAALADIPRRCRRMAVPGGERTLHRLQQRVDTHVGRLTVRPPGWLSRIPAGAVVVGRVVPFVALLDAGHGAVTGGGYDGWRGGATRGLAVVGAVGAGVAVVVGVGVAAPGAAVAGAVGLSAAAVYQAWMTGNWLYDNRGRIAETAARGWAGTRSVVGRAWSGGRGLVARARERAASGLERLRDRGGRTVQRRPERPLPPVAPGPAPVGAQA